MEERVIQFVAILENFNTPLWTYHIKIPEVHIQYLTKKNIKRVFCTLNGRLTFPAGIMSAANGIRFININKQRREKLKLKEGDTVKVSLVADRTRYGHDFPEEFKAVLEDDPEGKSLFDNLTQGKQRSLVYLIGKIKSEEIRIEKSLIILRHLHDNNGVLDFRMLNEAFKRGL